MKKYNFKLFKYSSLGIMTYAHKLIWINLIEIQFVEFKHRVKVIKIICNKLGILWDFIEKNLKLKLL